MKKQPVQSVGDRLRLLRRERGLNGDDLARWAGVSRTTLSHLENDVSEHRSKKTIENILKALDAVKPLTAVERKAFLAAFGYCDEDSLPTTADIGKAVQAWQDLFKESHQPAYLVDYAQRIHDWNDLALRLLGIEDKHLIPADITVFDLTFNPVLQRGIVLLNAEDFMPHMIAVTKSEFLPFLETDWCRKCLEKAWADYPVFKHLWDSVPDSALPNVNVHAMGPLLLRDRDDPERQLSFQLLGTDLVQDPRFRIIQYMPLDEETSLRCFRLSKRHT